MSYLASKNLKCNNSYQQQLNRKLKTPKFYPGATMAVTSGMLSEPEPWEGHGGKLGKFGCHILMPTMVDGTKF